MLIIVIFNFSVKCQAFFYCLKFPSITFTLNTAITSTTRDKHDNKILSTISRKLQMTKRAKTYVVLREEKMRYSLSTCSMQWQYNNVKCVWGKSMVQFSYPRITWHGHMTRMAGEWRQGMQVSLQPRKKIVAGKNLQTKIQLKKNIWNKRCKKKKYWQMK